MAGVVRMCMVCRAVQATYSCGCTDPPAMICEACMYTHSLTRGAHQHNPQALPRPRIEAAPTTCSVCHISTPEFVCTCSPTGPGFCTEPCWSIHMSTNTKKNHMFLPISARGRMTDRGYLDRLEKKQKAYKYGKQTLRKNLSWVDACKKKIENKVEFAIKKILQYKEKSLSELDTYKAKLEKLILTVESEIELHISDHDYVPATPLVAATLFNDKPPLRLFAFDNEKNLYRVWFEMRLEPYKDTLPVRWPIWAARPGRDDDNSDSSEEEYHVPRPLGRYRRPSPPVVTSQPAVNPSSQPPYYQPSSQPPSQPHYQPYSNRYEDFVPAQRLPQGNTSVTIKANVEVYNIEPPVVINTIVSPSPRDAVRPSFPPAPSSLVYFSLTPETISRTALLSTLSEVSIMASAVLLDDGNLFVCGDNDPVSGKTHLIDPKTGFLTPLANMKSQRFAHGMVLFHGEVFAFGGNDGTKAISSCEKYTAGSWEELASMNTPRCLFNPCLSGSTVYIFGGESTVDCEQYSISTNSFTNLPVQLSVPGQTSTVFLTDQELLIVQKGRTMKWKLGSPAIERTSDQPAIDSCWGSMNPVLFQGQAYISMFYEGSLLQVAT